MLAISKFCSTDLATLNAQGDVIPEIGIAKGRLDNLDDVHFGINGHSHDNARAGIHPDLKGLGPRILDIFNRGGRTAEDTWRALGYGRGNAVQAATPDFLNYYRAFNTAKPVRPGKEVYPPGAHYKQDDITGQRRYAAGALNKTQVGGTQGGLQMGVRWSKAALAHVLTRHNSCIHFHLDGMGNIDDIINKRGPFSHNVTSRELRYIYRNWAQFDGHVKFYNGYDGMFVVEVTRPW